MNYQILTPNDPAIGVYARFVRGHANCHFLQAPAWAKVKRFWSWTGIAVLDDCGEMVAAMSLLLRRLPLGFHVAYAPRGPVCDRNNPEIMALLTQGIRTVAKQNRCLLTYLDPDEDKANASFSALMADLGFREKRSQDFGGVQPQSVFRIDLRDKDPEALLASFAPKTRYNIRLAQRKGVTVTAYSGAESIPEEVLSSFASLMVTTGERDGFRVRNRAYFQDLLAALSGDAVLYMAALNGEVLAGTIAVFFGNKAWYLYGASSNESRGAMPNYLLQWTMICHALDRGCAIYDFRGVPGTGEPSDPLYGLYRFKKGFSGTHTCFTGLFLYYHRPLLGRVFDVSQNTFRKLRKRRLNHS